jgi:hypothetical protein
LRWRTGAPVLTVGVDVEDVERELVAGRLACPACGGMLARWGQARERQVRGRDGVSRFVRRRARCRGCQRTHVLLPVTCLARRADAAGVIGQALEAKAAGAGHRVIAEVLGRPASAVRGWLRALAARAEQVRSVFTALAVSLVIDPPLPAAAGSPVGDAVAAIAAAAAAAAQFLMVGEGGALAVGRRGHVRNAAGARLGGRDDQHELALGGGRMIGQPRCSADST